VAERALELALELTKSSVVFITLVDDRGDRKQVYTRAAAPSEALTEDQIDRFVERAKPAPATMAGHAAGAAGAGARRWLGGARDPRRADRLVERRRGARRPRSRRRGGRGAGGRPGAEIEP